MKHKGLWLFAAGAFMAMASVLLGNSMQAELGNMPLDTLMQQHGPVSLKFLLFAFGFPLGLGVSFLGASIGSGTARAQFWLFLCVVLVATSAASLVPALWGRQLSAMFFGNGGYGIMLLVLACIWYWGRYRARSPQAARIVVDLQGMGYLCFAIGVWNICGAASMPSFALEPDKMLALGSQSFAIGQMKAIMVLFILGWIFTLLSLRLGARQGGLFSEPDDAE